MTRTAGAYIAFAGLCGAAGVGLSAAAAHLAEAQSLGSAATICLVHAPVFLALAAIELGARRLLVLRIGSAMIAAGVVLFCTDVSLRSLLDSSLFPMAAPTGGSLMIGGWIVVCIQGLTLCFRSSRPP